MHREATILHFKEDGSLWTNAFARLMYKDLHTAFFHVDKVDCLASTYDYKWESFNIKTWKSCHEVFLIISWVWLLDDPADNFPIMYN